VVTRETEAAAPKINQLRAAKEFPALTVFVMELVADSSEHASKISSTLIRNRIQEKNGFNSEMREYYRKAWLQTCSKLFSAAGWKHPLTPALDELVAVEGDYIF